MCTPDQNGKYQQVDIKTPECWDSLPSPVVSIVGEAYASKRYEELKKRPVISLTPEELEERHRIMDFS